MLARRYSLRRLFIGINYFNAQGGIKMIKKRNTKVCYMCKEFLSSSTKSGERLCRISKKGVVQESMACEDFILGKLFFCHKRNKFMDMIACWSIRKTKKGNYGTKSHSAEHFAIIYQGCLNNCKQGQQVEYLFDQEGIPYVPYIPPQKITIRKRKTLIKRRIK